MDIIKLPSVKLKGNVSLEEAIHKRKSIRSFKNGIIKIDYLSQLLWSAQGKREGFYRTVPSAGATYPLEVFIVVGVECVENLEAGLYHYQNQKHELKLLIKRDFRQYLASACLWQEFISEAQIIFIICADYNRTTGRYGQRGIRYVHIEVGHAAQNLSLQAVALGLGSVMIGAFRDEEVSSLLELPSQFKPLYIIPVGHCCD